MQQTMPIGDNHSFKKNPPGQNAFKSGGPAKEYESDKVAFCKNFSSNANSEYLLKIQTNNRKTKNKFKIGLFSSTIFKISVLWTNDATNDANTIDAQQNLLKFKLMAYTN